MNLLCSHSPLPAEGRSESHGLGECLVLEQRDERQFGSHPKTH
jgi:hypothetical protein